MLVRMKKILYLCNLMIISNQHDTHKVSGSILRPTYKLTQDFKQKNKVSIQLTLFRPTNQAVYTFVYIPTLAFSQCG